MNRFAVGGDDPKLAAIPLHKRRNSLRTRIFDLGTDVFRLHTATLLDGAGRHKIKEHPAGAIGRVMVRFVTRRDPREHFPLSFLEPSARQSPSACDCHRSQPRPFAGRRTLGRYRLRFLLQEFDLRPGETVLGRSSECHITIEDPLVSRMHAKILVGSGGVVVEDLGSRNGMKLNGRRITGTHPLADGDRIRIGTQELVFCIVAANEGMVTRTTGFLRHCAACRLPYAAEAGACPNCGAAEFATDDTLAGKADQARAGGWHVRLLVEMLERSVQAQRFEDAERILRRASTEVEEAVVVGDRLDDADIARLCQGALQVVEALETSGWGVWALGLLRKAPTSVDGALATRLAACARFADVAAALGEWEASTQFQDVANLDARSTLAGRT